MTSQPFEKSIRTALILAAGYGTRMEDLVKDWNHPYSRQAACFPPGAFRVDKYWPPVNRVDNAYGDRHLVCTCPPMSDYADAAE